MTLNLKTVIKGFDGTPIKDQKQKLVDGKVTIVETDFTVKMAIDQALSNQLPGDDADVKAKCFTLGCKMYASDKPDFTVDELTLMKTRVGIIFAPVVYGRVAEAIEAAESAKSAK